MQYRGMSRSHLFLIELITVILFFSVAGAITVQVFNKAHELDQHTTALNGAVIAVQTAAETDKTVPFQEIDTEKDTVYYNGDWKITDSSDAIFIMTSEVALEKRAAGSMAVYTYEVTADDKLIYRLQTKKYYPGETGSDASPGEVN